MFNNTYGLTDSVKKGIKTATTRFEPRLDGVEKGDFLMFPRQGKIVIYGEKRPPSETIPMKYKVGETVAVAQNYQDVYEELKRTHGSSSSVTREFFHKYVQGGRMPVSNKMFVKPEIMPSQIQITDIKMERLQDISDKDCFREGITANNVFEIGYGVDFVYEFTKSDMYYFTPREAFAALIDKVSGKGTWERNPWVIRYYFELRKQQ